MVIKGKVQHSNKWSKNKVKLFTDRFPPYNDKQINERREANMLPQRVRNRHINTDWLAQCHFKEIVLGNG